MLLINNVKTIYFIHILIRQWSYKEHHKCSHSTYNYLEHNTESVLDSIKSLPFYLRNDTIWLFCSKNYYKGLNQQLKSPHTINRDYGFFTLNWTIHYSSVIKKCFFSLKLLMYIDNEYFKILVNYL